MKTFLTVLVYFRDIYGEWNVFPSDVHLRSSELCIEAHHKGKGETEETIELRSKLMQRYFEMIDDADLVVVVNEKNGQEYYGVGTMIELGYAFAKKKVVRFKRKPTDANIMSLALLERV